MLDELIMGGLAGTAKRVKVSLRYVSKLEEE